MHIFVVIVFVGFLYKLIYIFFKFDYDECSLTTKAMIPVVV